MKSVFAQYGALGDTTGTLFALAMNILVKAAEAECRAPPPIGAYMADLTVTTSSVPGNRWILQGLEKLIKWAKISFKPTKSRSLVLKKGRVSDKFHFALEFVKTL